ncbi:arylsulfotransferase family protein [Halogeometricum luteum]|uniref:Aryl-sulfate sulfotransferase n=1 Tax=Halogeometricum luteum TaxID=2950537 RepID=A0ABU2FYM5_9EURY|nr:arylsulfotransferase family protein [Halogeometricum sp. S3BR5-2]MDS0293033.1 aryl-sulfate sulfotransferase [Halogeometricum sp. S3BR5-2]
MVSKRAVRALFVAVLCLSTAGVAYGYAAGSSGSTFESHISGGTVDGSEQVVPPRDGITVVATDSNSWRGRASEGPRARAELVAFAPNGTTMYYNDTHTRYWDVDPVPGTEATVEYMYADHLEPGECPTEWNLSKRGVSQEKWDRYQAGRSSDACTRNGFERVNLSTGETTEVWDRVTPGKEATRYHDADRLNETHLVVADIYLDRVFVVDTRDGQTEWTWNASESFDPDSGDDSPGDWTHINDVEILDDGRIMVSARNQDRVVFVDENGLDENWTLGAEDDTSILYEQHNPDFIPAERGGPAVLVADSENNRVIEYQRTNGTWEQSWHWRDGRMQWPRDADRLPNGHTLISDSNANRVFEVNEDGEIVWRVDIAFPYESERLGTGDESAGGPSAASGDLQSKDPSLADQASILVKQIVPGRYLNGLMYITPVWMGLPEILATLLAVGTLFAWGGAEATWRWRGGARRE